VRNILASTLLSRDPGIYNVGTRERVVGGATMGMCARNGVLARVRYREPVVETYATDTWTKLGEHRLENPRGHYHDLRLFGDLIYAVDSIASTVELYSWSMGFTPLGSVNFIPNLEDPVHLNSVVPSGNTMLGLVFGLSKLSGGWHAMAADSGALLSFGNMAVVTSGLSQPHSLHIPANASTMFCDSGAAAVVQLCGEQSRTHNFGSGFARGLLPEPSGSYWLGMSVMRASDKANAAVLHVDSDGTVLQETRLPAREIYELVEV
jgi:hypothetical protein